MKKLVFILLIVPILSFAQQNNTHKTYIEGGIAGGSYSSNALNVGVYGGFGVFFEALNHEFSLDFRAKELYITNFQREAGALSGTLRWYLFNGGYVGGGIAHNHEVPLKAFVEEPLAAIMGNGKSIIHRSGGVLEVGYDFKSILKKYGLYPTTNMSVTYLALDEEPNPYINLSLGLRFGLKAK